MMVQETPLAGLRLIELRAYTDPRGVFVETYREEAYADVGISARFVQDSYSRSVRGVIRGVHFQVRHPQAKLVHVPRGEVFDVAVDLRRNSPTFGRWFGTVLSEANHRQLFVPAGFGHGFCALSETADVHYKFSAYYQQADESGVIWNDPDVGIVWPIDRPQVSEKDRRLRQLHDLADASLPAGFAE